MTTATASRPRSRGFVMLLGAAGGAFLVGLVLGLVGLIVSGSAAAAGALVGTMLAVGVFVAGTVVVHLVAKVVPTAALLVALLTFTLQVLLMALVFFRLNQSGLLTDGTLAPRWLAAALVASTLVWCAGQILAVTKARIPVYELPEEPVGAVRDE